MAQVFDFTSGGVGPNPLPPSGSNQFFPTMPSLPNMSPGGGASTGRPAGDVTAMTGSGPGFSVPPATGLPGTGASFSTNNPYQNTWTPIGLGQSTFQEPSLSPPFTGAFGNMLSGQIGQGVSPFNLSTQLPWGQTTGAGQLNAPLNPIMQQLLSFYQTGQTPQGMPGLGTLSNVATQGISAVGPWQSMVDAMQRQIQQGGANLAEQFNVGTGLAGTPFGTAASDYWSQTTKDLNAQLAQMQFQGIGEQIGAAQGSPLPI